MFQKYKEADSLYNSSGVQLLIFVNTVYSLT
jgi:hypothetical protein